MYFSVNGVVVTKVVEMCWLVEIRDVFSRFEDVVCMTLKKWSRVLLRHNTHSGLGGGRVSCVSLYKISMDTEDTTHTVKYHNFWYWVTCSTPLQCYDKGYGSRWLNWLSQIRIRILSELKTLAKTLTKSPDPNISLYLKLLPKSLRKS